MSVPKKKRAVPLTTVNLRLQPSVVKELDAAAERNQRSRNQMACIALQDWLKARIP